MSLIITGMYEKFLVHIGIMNASYYVNSDLFYAE